MASLIFSLSLLAKHTHDKRKERKATARAEFNDARYLELQRETDEAVRSGGKTASRLEYETETETETEQRRGSQERDGERDDDKGGSLRSLSVEKGEREEGGGEGEGDGRGKQGKGRRWGRRK